MYIFLYLFVVYLRDWLCFIIPIISWWRGQLRAVVSHLWVCAGPSESILNWKAIYFWSYFNIYVEIVTAYKTYKLAKCLFGVFNFFQKPNENTSHSNKNEFIRSFFGRIQGYQKSFRNYLTFKKLETYCDLIYFRTFAQCV